MLRLRSRVATRARYTLGVLAALLLGIAGAFAQTPDETERLGLQVEQLHREGKHVEALAAQRTLAAKVEREERAKGGRPGRKTAEALGNLAWYALLVRSHKEGLAASTRAVALAPGLLVPETNRAHALLLTGRRAEARKVYLAHKQKRVFDQSDKLWEDVIAEDFEALRAAGVQHPEFAKVLTALGVRNPELSREIAAIRAQLEQLHGAGKYKEAGVAAERYVALTRERFGEKRSEFAAALSSLGLSLQRSGRPAEAEASYQRSLNILEMALGVGHPEVATALSNLASLYQAQSRTNETEPLYKRALAITEKALGPGHPDVGTSLNNLAALYEAQGRYGEAEPLYQRALAIAEKALGPDHPLVGTSLNNLAGLYRAQGRYGEAEPLYQRTLTIYVKALGPDHPDVGTSLNNLAGLYRAQSRYGEAEPLYQRALAMREKALGPDHPLVGAALNNLAGLYFVQRDWARAADFWRRSTGVIVRRAQRGTDDVGQALTGKRRGEAEQFGYEFWGLVKVGQRLASEGRTGDASLAREMFQTAQWASASEAAASLAQMAARGAKGDASLAALVRERQDLVGEWQKRDQVRSAAVSQAPDKRDRAVEVANAARLAVIDARIGEIDKRLAADFPDYTALTRPQPLGIAEVQTQLRADEALVLFLDTPEWEPLSEETFIWVVTKTDFRWVKSGLGTAALRERVAALRCGLDEEEWSGNTRASKCAALLGRTDAPADDEPPAFHLGIAHDLYLSLFGPVEELIKGKHLLIVPSGPLTSVPFHVLVTKKPETVVPVTFEGYRAVAWLARSHAVTVLPSVASLSALRVQSAKRPKAPADYIGIGNPILTGTSSECRDYKVPNQCPTVEAAGSPRPELTVASAERATVRRRGGRRNAGKSIGEVYAKGADPAGLIKQVRAMCPLPDTDYELRCVGERFPQGRYDLYLDKLATETGVRTLNADGTLARYRIVHFATHGLVAGDLETMAKRQGEPALVLTPPAQPADADDDGLLTASEVAQLKLNADWVVLSACSTAASDGANAEALSGLARAFFYAGTRALLVSHWPVYSDAAVQLTTRTFAELEGNPQIGRAEAFRRAMIALINDPSQASNAHPAVWAPFVVVGEGGTESDFPPAARK